MEKNCNGEKIATVKNCNGEKIDKGFELVYWNLSYRRKFIRSLWATPFLIFAIILGWVVWKSVLVAALFTILGVGIEITQVIYTYKKWKNIDNNMTDKLK